MDSKDKSDLLARYTRPPYPALVKPDPAAHTPDQDEDDEGSGYEALREHREKKGTSRFRIVKASGQAYGGGYAYLLGWLYEPPGTLTIYTTTHIFGLTGRHLQKIEKSLMREKVEQLREFDPTKDTAPADGEPVIESLSVTSRFEG